MRALMAFILLNSLTPVCSQSQSDASDTSTVILGENYAFSLSPPQGWAIDTTVWSDPYGLKAGIYPLDGSFRKFPPILVLVASKKLEGKETMKNLLALQKGDSVTKATDIKVFAKTQDKKSVYARRFDGVDRTSLEALIDDEQIVVLIALQSLDKQRFSDILPAFKALLESYVSVKKIPKNSK